MNIFAKTGGLKPGRSVFDLSYAKIFDCYAGQLIPVMADEVVPGDYFEIGNEMVIRMAPLVSPVLHEIKVHVHYFFVPYRILSEDWEPFITGGVDGQDESVIPRLVPDNTPVKGSLWDYLGFPLVRLTGLNAPLAFPYMAYRLIWNEYYRDETLQNELDVSDVTPSNGGVIKFRDWRKDYFTSALPWQQRGIAPALPISGITHAVWPDSAIIATAPPIAGTPLELSTSAVYDAMYVNSANARDNLKSALEANTVDLSAATSVNISELRQSVQIQKWMERNARAGVRYTEFLREHFGVSPSDERLQRPEYIGGSKAPIIVSEVLKTAEDGADPQGNLAGHGVSASMGYCGKYHAKEYGVIMGLMSIMPEPVYASQGIDRQWLRRDRFDFYFPEFAHLSEQAIEREEIYASGVEVDDRTVWGYQGRYDEMRVKRSGVMNNMRDTLSHWHCARRFSSAPALNDAFLQCQGTESTQTAIFAVPEEPGFLVHFGNKIKASRPLPIMSDPGMMDHF